MTDRLFDPSAPPPPTTRQDPLGRPIPDAAPPLTPPPGEHVVRANEQAIAADRLAATAPAARHDDPETSHEAAERTSGATLTQRREDVLLIVDTLGPLTHETLVELLVDPLDGQRFIGGQLAAPQTPSGVRTRCNELTKTTPPLVEWTGDYEQLRSGSRARTWRTTVAGHELALKLLDERTQVRR